MLLNWKVAEAPSGPERREPDTHARPLFDAIARVVAIGWLIAVVMAHAGPAGAAVQIIDENGDGLGNVLMLPYDVAANLDGSKTYVTGNQSNTVFEIPVLGPPILILDASGDSGVNTLAGPYGVAVGDDGRVYVSGL
ncbi:MAG: hypothetical protein JRG92_17825, partial [Deltaproteobacteria bacterium]|nr:hypothetical protein [Deltaproteobacteria bacterium]